MNTDSISFKKAVEGPSVRFISAKDLMNAGSLGEVLVGTLSEKITGEFRGKATTSYAFNSLSDGGRIVVNGCGSLDRQLRDVAEGTLCRISFEGQYTVNKGPNKGTKAYQFLVEIADNAE